MKSLQQLKKSGANYVRYMRSRQGLTLSALEGDRDGDTLAPLGPAPLQRVLTCGRRHARTKPVSTETMDFARLIGTLHGGTRFWAILPLQHNFPLPTPGSAA